VADIIADLDQTLKASQSPSKFQVFHKNAQAARINCLMNERFATRPSV